MRAPRFLYSKNPSKCCKHKALIVQSRAGGFISQNCLKCGKSDYINEGALPDVACDSCTSPLAIDRIGGKNYFYVCGKCNRSWKIADSVPHWSELFAYSGLAVDSDLPAVGWKDHP